MKRALSLVLLLFIVVMMPSVAICDNAGRESSATVLTTLDVSHAAAYGTTSAAYAPLIYESAFALRMPTLKSDFSEYVNSIRYEVFPSTLERPPQV
jgi:hypothetical protein